MPRAGFDNFSALIHADLNGSHLSDVKISVAKTEYSVNENFLWSQLTNQDDAVSACLTFGART